MERNEFLGNLGAGTAFEPMFPYKQGCSKDNNGDLGLEDMKPVQTTGFFQCSIHGSRFDQTGKLLNNITTNPLKFFKVEQSGNMLRLFE